MTPHPDGPAPSSRDLLRSMVDGSAQDEVRSAEESARGLLARLTEAEDSTALTPQELAAIDEVTSEPQAGLGLRSLRARVEAGIVTWDEVWRRPEHHGPEAVRLVFAVLAHTARATPSPEEVVAGSELLSASRRDPGSWAGRRQGPPTGPVLGR